MMKAEQEPMLISREAKRSCMEIDVEILKACNTPKRMTMLMLSTRLNCTLIKQRIAELEKKELIKSIQLYKRSLSKKPIPTRSKVFQTTPKGMGLVSAYNQLANLYNSHKIN